LGRQPDALKEWEQAAKLDPTEASAYYHLFRIYLALKDTKKAAYDLEQFKKLSALY
jgi:tetratricopeptide (TPR) repeat protein